MAIIEKIIELNKAGKPVVWPPAPKMEECIICDNMFPSETMTYSHCADCWRLLNEEERGAEINTHECIRAGR